MSIFDFLDRKKKQQDPDAAVLTQLGKAGSNLSKPHQVEFFLYFPNQQIAERAAVEIRAAGFSVKTQPGAQGDDWLCFATKDLVPALDTLQGIRRNFEYIARTFGGEYDGWGTPIVTD